MNDPRINPPQDKGEIETLLGFLDYQRATLKLKTDGVSDADLARSISPTNMTLGGLIKHLSYVEDYWFTQIVGESPMPEPWLNVDWSADPDWDWNSAAGDKGDNLRSLWEQSRRRSDNVVSKKLSEGDAVMDQTYSAWGGKGSASLRWVLVHMIEEYARHNGHADLLRQSVDGQTGE